MFFFFFFFLQGLFMTLSNFPTLGLAPLVLE